MPRYDFVLFDADNTLYDFDRAERRALRLVLEARGYPVNAETEGLYRSINRALWARFDRGEVERDWLVVERFAAFTRVMGGGDDPAEFNRDYLARLGEGSFLLPGAEALCRRLAPLCTLAIVTNGVASAQRARFNGSALNGVIPHLFISEELGASKPSPAFFAPVMQALGIAERSRAVVVGDNLLTDIQGGANAGLDTVWFNPGRLPGDSAVSPTWEVESFSALEALLLG